MKIDKITLKNFRNYYGEVSFDLRRKITILHGDNGFGKSSFFDAIEWCFTSKISRMDGTDAEIKRDIFNKRCKFQENEVLSVSIEFDGNTLTRWFSVTGDEHGNDYGYTQVALNSSDGKSYRGQVDVESFLKQGTLDQTSFGRGSYGQLIKQTFILSQSQVADFVTSEEPSERFRALADIMGFRALLNESDNMKKIHTSLIKQSEAINNQITSQENSIKGKEEVKKEVNIFEFNKKLLDIGFKEFDSNIDTQINESHEQALSDKVNAEKFLELYKEMNLERFETVRIIVNQISEKETIHEKLKTRGEEVKALLKRINQRTDSLIKESENIQNYNQMRKTIQEKEQELALYDMNSVGLDKVREKLNVTRPKASSLEFMLSFQPTIEQNLEQQKKLPANRELSIKMGATLRRRKEKLVNLTEKLSLVIQENKDNLLLQLIANMKDIQGYVAANNLERCPVCSSTPEENLETCIDHNILSYTTKLEEDTSYVSKAISLRSKILNKLAKTDDRINETSNNITKLNLELERLKEEYNNYRNNDLFSEELSQAAVSELNDELNKVREEIILQQKIIELKISSEKLKDELKDFGNENSSKIIKTENEIEQSIQRMRRASGRIVKHQNQIESNIKQLYSDIQDNQIIVKRLHPFLKPEQYDIPLQSLISKNKDLIFSNERKIGRLTEVSQVQYTIKHNQEIQNQIQDVKKTIEDLYNKKTEIDQIADSLKKYIMQLFDFFDSDTRDYLNDNNSPIQKYYRYLNPLPSNDLIQFDGADEKLSIKVVFEDSFEESNAQNILSSGQLNVLAISIFLAINEAQNIIALDFIAIDDPIQNMDDVNQYSICDVLGQLDKQIIFSTHDLDFVKLFLKKNEHKKEDMQVFNFTSPFLVQNKIQHILY
ncbi:exonuclease SbcC [Paenibacillus sp. W4I10]|uniref:AAA family ATPase n=1 Tax=Paenibacillus sp. W4I10 TaxID=3042298 RepID=UPI00278A7728|nr:SMC family ATPase [Paenibacillus sp. W4I10]MDQ0721910.1 exonuclease SbcC [Paenibacillus sp. W4I10]